MLKNEISKKEKQIVIRGLETVKKTEEINRKIQGLKSLLGQGEGPMAQELEEEIAVLTYELSELETRLDEIRKNKLFIRAMKKPPFNSIVPAES